MQLNTNNYAYLYRKIIQLDSKELHINALKLRAAWVKSLHCHFSANDTVLN